MSEKELDIEDQKKLSFFNIEEFLNFFEEEDSKDKRVAGYKVKVRYQPLSEQEGKERRRTISKVILDSLRKLKGD